LGGREAALPLSETGATGSDGQKPRAA